MNSGMLVIMHTRQAEERTHRREVEKHLVLERARITSLEQTINCVEDPFWVFVFPPWDLAQSALIQSNAHVIHVYIPMLAKALDHL